MRSVARRLLYGEAAQGLAEWKMRVLEARNSERAECIMKRVGARWGKQEVVLAVERWHGKQVEEKKQQRGEGILRRVGGRWRHKEMAMRWDVWHKKFKSGTIEMVSVRWCM